MPRKPSKVVQKPPPRVVPCPVRFIALAGDFVVIDTHAKHAATFPSLAAALKAARPLCAGGETPRALPVPAVLAKHNPATLFDAAGLMLCALTAARRALPGVPAPRVLPLSKCYNALLFTGLVRERDGFIELTDAGALVLGAFGTGGA